MLKYRYFWTNCLRAVLLFALVGPVSDGRSQSIPQELKVSDDAPPPPPTVNQIKSRSPRPLITGTWAEDQAARLTVEVAGKTYELGRDIGLRSDGRGNWALTLDVDLADSTYDVVVTITDTAGNSSADRDFGEVVIDGASLPQRPLSSDNTMSANQCQALVDDAMRDAQIRFSPGNAAILGENAGLLDRLADAIRQCGDLDIEIAGHTDWQGSRSYNQTLSERRAGAVRDSLLARRVRPDIITAVGYGESRPIADNRSRQGRAANRRTEFRVLNRGN